MYVKPSVEDFLDAVSLTLAKEIAPELQTEKAQITLAMIQTILQCAKQIAHAEQQIMATEHNEMTELFRDVGAIVGESAEPEADRLRARARDLGGRENLAPMPSWADLSRAYNELSAAVVASLEDVDGLIRAGNAAGETALTRVRAHLGPRTAREFGTYTVSAGMVGRG